LWHTQTTSASSLMENIHKHCDLLTAKLNILSEWTIENGLGVNPSKTELVLFTNRYKIPQLNPPILNNCNLSFSDHARYLGLVLDKRLKWGVNNQERTKKAAIVKKAIGGPLCTNNAY